MDFATSKVRELQAALFPIQPIPSSVLTNQCLQNRFGITRRDVDSVLSLTSGILKYRDTRETFQSVIDANLISVDGITQEARWPTECQVIAERIRHADYTPAIPEPYYTPTGKEPKPKPVCDETGTVIFRYCPTSVTNYFSRSCIGGSTVLSRSLDSILNPVESKRELEALPRDLCFESRFESGNLGKVIKITETYYQLHLRRDLYTQRHMQWYYFRISNTRSGTMYRLSIVNFCKEDSLYNEGLRPLLYSTKDASLHEIGWRRCGENISYYKNDSSDEEKERHTLTFNIYFPHDRDIVYLAHSYPYTYTDLQEYLSGIASDPVKTRYTKLRLLCRSLAGNGVYYLTITAPAFTEESRKKKGVVITARVHPGETPSSWMMKGIIDFLTGDSNQAKELRERFIFKVVPMLNPDGVIVGNNRCSLSGKDLNRQYRTVMRESYPSVWHTKLMIRRLMEECGIAMYCDLHSHSRKPNIFIYGCESKRAGCYGRLTEQVFPLMLHKNAADKFSFENCKFHIEKGKEGTGRVVVWLMGVSNSYTMEASMGGSQIGSRAGTHFSAQDYEQIGKSFCETLLDFSDDCPTKERLRNKIIARLLKEGSSADVPTNINLTDYSSDEGVTSDSSSEEGIIESMDVIQQSDDNFQFLSVPPPSPLEEWPRTTEKLRKSRKRNQRKALIRKKISANRTAMDLPTTDPGSDLCDHTDSDENYLQSLTLRSAKEKEFRDNCKDLKEQSIFSGNEEPQENELFSLPTLARPRSLSLGEELITKETFEERRYFSRFHPLPRNLRNLSPILPRVDDVPLKLTTLRQKIWTGVKFEKSAISLRKSPLSWGISNMARGYQTDSDALLKSCSKKLQALNYVRKPDAKKLKKKSPKKSARIINILPIEDPPEEESLKPLKKKRCRLKRQRALNSNLNLPYIIPSLVPREKDDSMKLFGVPKTQKSQTKKPEPRKKLRKGGSGGLTPGIVSKRKTKPIVDSFEDSSSSEDTPVMRIKATRKKKTGTRKKRSSSALVPSTKRN
ncbi:cytosolic carboxypeptidase 2-like isoform X2 [Belonocnema kinseyi]|uniref:cytosolic carboxypeptidase 2-like isoform X2 n=1 Tax=Belonocnema kinseyi TaxID=2817044 RepID=UPI00143CDBD5|nr:cytosolic carboxypeptidase 2-like isoform X2 [Belonocnema kinseyi]